MYLILFIVLSYFNALKGAPQWDFQSNPSRKYEVLIFFL